MLIKFAGDLGEIAALHRVAGLVIRVIAPHPQRHFDRPASASVSSQYGFGSRVNFEATISSWTWTRASSSPLTTA